MSDPTNKLPQQGSVLIAAYEAALSIASEVDLPTVLQRLVDLARQVLPAKYAALGVTDEQGTIVEFITSGISLEERRAIGPIPQGHGMLGELITSRRSLLVPDIAADPRSVGFPAHHPPMRTLIGVPILHADRVLGNLYLTERLDGQPFDDDDLELLQVFATHAATAIDRAHLYQQLAAARRRAEEQRDHLRTILDNLPAGVWIQTVPDNTIELANTTAIDMLSGPHTPWGTLPRPERDFRLHQIDGAPLAHHQRPAERAMRGETVRNRRLILENWSGQRAPVLVQASPLRDGRGEVTRVVIVMQDVTRLHEAEQLKDDFLSLISHEFRTPLTAIHGGAYLLANQSVAIGEETRRELLADIVVESDRLDRMLTNMLSLVAVQAGRLEPSTEPVLIEPLARRVARDIGSESRGHQIVIDIGTGLPPIEADPDQLAQVLRNLYENAIKYSPRGSDIRVTGRRLDSTVAIEVTDSGSGIAAEHVSQVFERFRRPGADPTVRGMGLGLYLCRSLIEAQGGEIFAASAGPGQGATFSVVLPIADGWESAHDSDVSDC